MDTRQIIANVAPLWKYVKMEQKRRVDIQNAYEWIPLPAAMESMNERLITENPDRITPFSGKFV